MAAMKAIHPLSTRPAAWRKPDSPIPNQTPILRAHGEGGHEKTVDRNLTLIVALRAAQSRLGKFTMSDFLWF